jgi:hypothetical protein
MDSYPRTGKRCKNEYRFKKTTNLCHRTEKDTPIASHNSRSYRRNGKRCKPTYRQNKSKKLCISKLVSPSPVSYESYERLGKRCKKSYRHHTSSGLCVYTKKRRSRTTRELPLPLERQEEIVKSPLNSPIVNYPESPLNSSIVNYPESPLNSPVVNYPESPNVESPLNSTVVYSPELPKKNYGNQIVNNLEDY